MKRDPRFDVFRGVALLAIAVNHTFGPHGMEIKVGHFWFFDFADVFLFISGAVCGMAFYKRMQWWGFASCQRRALRRAGTLYLANIATFAVCLYLVWMVPRTGNSYGPLDKMYDCLAQPDQLLTKMLLLISTSYLLDVLTFYVGMVALAPLAIKLYLRSRPLAIFISLASYAYVQILPRTGWADPLESFVGFGYPLALQLLFCIGLWLGIEAARGTLRIPVNGPLVAAALLCLAAGLLARQFEWIDLWRWSSKRMVRPMRITELLLVTYVIAACWPATRPLWRSEWLTPVAACGQRPLTMYCCGTVVSYGIIVISHSQQFGYMRYLLLNVIGTAALMSSH